MKFLQLCFLFYFQTCKEKHLTLFFKKLNTFPERKNNTGNDERFIKNETEINNQLFTIYKNYEKKRLLDTLENKNVSMNIKLDLLKDNSIKPTNLKAGGLMKDFDFKFD
jgi:hypothetical protein